MKRKIALVFDKYLYKRLASSRSSILQSVSFTALPKISSILPTKIKVSPNLVDWARVKSSVNKETISGSLSLVKMPLTSTWWVTNIFTRLKWEDDKSNNSRKLKVKASNTVSSVQGWQQCTVFDVIRAQSPSFKVRLLALAIMLILPFNTRTNCCSGW